MFKIAAFCWIVSAELAATVALGLDPGVPAYGAVVASHFQRNLRKVDQASVAHHCRIRIEVRPDGLILGATLATPLCAPADVMTQILTAVIQSSPIPPRPAGVKFEPVIQVSFGPAITK